MADHFTNLVPTGERYHPEMRGSIRYEHLHRYALCLKMVEGLDVLDVASGEGYGSALLATRARHVTGVDIERQAVDHARHVYYCPNVRFLTGSCIDLPLEDGSVDVVVSFETLEHVDEHDRMLSEIRRVLRPGGKLVISSPNKFVYSDRGGYSNPFHVRELYYDEFLALLGRHFRSIEIRGQRLAAASFVFPLVGRCRAGVVAYNGSEAEETQEGLRPLQNPNYFIAVCSDAALQARELESFFLDPKDDVLEALQFEHARLLEQAELFRKRLNGSGNAVLHFGPRERSEQPLALGHHTDELDTASVRYEARIDALTREVEQLRAGRDAAVLDAAQALERTQRLARESSALQEQLDAAAASNATLQQRLDELDVEAERLQSEGERLRSEHATERDRFQAEIAAAALALQELGVERDGLRSELEAARVREAATYEREQAAARALHEVLGSRSWRVTEPIRKLSRSMGLSPR